VRRYAYGMLIIGLLALIPALITAQDVPPVTTEEPGNTNPPIVPTAESPTAVVTEEPPAVAVPEGIVPIPTAIGIPADAAPVPTQASGPVSPINPAAIPILINARTDLELLASQQLGGARPTGWSGSLDITDSQLPLLTRLDLELLAGQLMGADIRPDGWFGPVPGSTVTIARDIRHDLELLADTVDVPNVRPVGWAGDDPLMRCDRGIQALVNVLERGGVFSLNVDSNDFNFCALAELQASQFAEQNVLNFSTTTSTTNNPAAPAVSNQSPPPAGSIQVVTDLAVAFLNRYGTEQVGIIPPGTSMTPVARSFTEFSRMTLVRGDNFEVFIDFQETTLTEEQFAVLPDVNGVSVNTVCNAEWCKPILQTLGNPASGRTGASSSSGAASASGQTKVSVDNLVIYYDGGDANNTAIVRLQLCAQPRGASGNTCQTVDRVIAPNGTPLVPVGTLSGMPQYRLPYGYSTHGLYAANYYMSDVWISSPGDR
jgi:hypothetical protein